jgi:hypothetical protein
MSEDKYNNDVLVPFPGLQGNVEPRDSLLINSTTKSWFDFMNSRPQGIDPVIEAFIKESPQALKEGSPRKWTELSELIQEQNSGFAPWSVKDEAVELLLGSELSRKFMDFAVAKGHMDQAHR